jgi:hypothetical protein
MIAATVMIALGTKADLMKRGRRPSYPNESIPLEAIPVRRDVPSERSTHVEWFSSRPQDSFLNMNLVTRFAESQCKNLTCIRAHPGSVDS